MEDWKEKIEARLSEAETQIRLVIQKQDSYADNLNRIESALNKISDKMSEIEKAVTGLKATKTKHEFTDVCMDIFQDVIKYAILGGLIYYFMKGGM